MRFINSLFLFMFLANSFFCQNDTIVWKTSENLKIADFLMKPDTIKYKGIRAISMIGFDINNRIKTDTIFINCYAYFLKSKSWYVLNKNEQKNKNLLSHENGHFHITEIELRKLKQQLLQTRISDVAHFKLVYNNLFNSFVKNESEMHKKYDSETNLSMNETKQKEWNTKLLKELDVLKVYSNNIVKIPFAK